MNLSINKEEIAADAMKQARAWLDMNKIRYQYLPPYQLKIGQINFWPGRGTITIDGEPGKRPVSGLIGLESVLRPTQDHVANVQASATNVDHPPLRLYGSGVHNIAV